MEVITKFIVSTVDARQTIHTYEFPTGQDSLKTVKPIMQRWAEAFAERRRMVPMSRPTVFYNIDHVVSVGLELSGAEDVEGVVEEATRTMGFPIPSSTEAPGS